MQVVSPAIYITRFEYAFSPAEIRKRLSVNSKICVTSYGPNNHADVFSMFLPKFNEPRPCKWLLEAMIKCMQFHEASEGCFVVRACSELLPEAQKWLSSQPSSACVLDVNFKLEDPNCFCTFFVNAMFDSEPEAIPRAADAYLVNVQLLSDEAGQFARVAIDCCA